MPYYCLPMLGIIQLEYTYSTGTVPSVYRIQATAAPKNAAVASRLIL